MRGRGDEEASRKAPRGEGEGPQSQGRGQRGAAGHANEQLKGAARSSEGTSHQPPRGFGQGGKRCNLPPRPDAHWLQTRVPRFLLALVCLFDSAPLSSSQYLVQRYWSTPFLKPHLFFPRAQSTCLVRWKMIQPGHATHRSHLSSQDALQRPSLQQKQPAFSGTITSNTMLYDAEMTSPLLIPYRCPCLLPLFAARTQFCRPVVMPVRYVSPLPDPIAAQVFAGGVQSKPKYRGPDGPKG